MTDLLLAIQAILIIAKLAGLITISWWYVLVPLWIILVIWFIAFVMVCIMEAN